MLGVVMTSETEDLWIEFSAIFVIAEFTWEFLQRDLNYVYWDLDLTE